MKILTLLNKRVISSSKSLSSSNEVEIFPKSSKDTNEVFSCEQHVYNGSRKNFLRKNAPPKKCLRENYPPHRKFAPKESCPPPQKKLPIPTFRKIATQKLVCEFCLF